MSRLLRLYEKKRGERRTGSSKLGSAGEALFFTVFLVLGLATFLGMMLTIIWPELRANRHFVETTCTVLSAKVSESRSEDRTTYRPDIEIEFKRGGRTFRTVTYDAARLYTSDRDAAVAAVAQFEKGKRYKCWYDPLNPQRAVLVRGYSGWVYLLLLVPISFIAIGGAGLIYTLWHWRTSAERRSALAQRAAKIDLLNDELDGSEELPHVPSASDWKSSPGTNLAYRLPIATAPGWQLFTIFIICLIWNSVTTVFVVVAVRSHINGDPEWFLTFFIIPFILVGLGLIYAFIRQLLINTGIGPTRMEISQHPLRPGDRFEVFLSQAGRLSMNSLEVFLICEEQASYRQGTDTRTESRQVLKQSVFRRDSFEIDQAIPFEHQWEIEIPTTAMHSFKSTHNEIKWKLVVHGDVAGWPNYEREYPIIVYPPLHREAVA